MYSERFNRAYNALVQAFFGGTLAKGTCAACAVGNIVAAGQGGKISKGDFKGNLRFTCNTNNQYWGNLFFTDFGGKNFRSYISIPKNDYDHPYLSKLYTETGYKAEELAEVEHQFEISTNIRYHTYYNHSEQEILEDQFKGLMAVMDVLLKIEGIEEGTELKNKFKEHPRLVLA